MVRSLIPAVVSVYLVLVGVARGQDLGAVVNRTGTNVTGVTFRVWVPNASAVRVAGEFNNWNSTANSLTNNSTDRIWTGTVAGARPGQAYKYVITTTNNQTLWRKDPRGRAVRSLPEGSVPAAVTNGSSPQASVVYDKDAFDWTGDSFVPPEPKDIVMYELHIGTFNDPTPFDDNPATFDDAIQRLDYLKELGVNMIALMPVSEFSGRHSWGYNPSDPFAIEETYGGPDGFKRFVKAAHLRGMAVQVDVVHNHYGTLSTNAATWQSAQLSDLENFDGGEPYFYNAADEVARPGISKTKWGPRPRYSDSNVRSYVKDNIKMYLDEYKVWALRWDSPRNITGYQANPTGAAIGDPNTEIPEAVSMMQEIHAEIASNSRPNAFRYYSIAEDAFNPNDPAPVRGGYTGHWEISYHDTIFSRLLGSPLPPPFAQKYGTPASMGSIKFRIENKEDPGFRVVFLENHDKCGDLNSATDGKRLAHDFDANNPTSVTAKGKTLMAAAATLTAAGVPMLWMGQEQLADGDFNDKSALDWNRAAQFPGIVRFHRDLVHLRKSLPALRTAAATPAQAAFVSVVHTNDVSGLLAFRRSDGVSSANDVVVAMNFSASDNVLPPTALAGGFTNVLINSRSTNYDAQLTPIGPPAGSSVAGNTSITLGPWSVVMLARSSVALPPLDANGNGIDDGVDMLAGTRAALAGTFNDWDVATPAMKWDPMRRVYWYVARFNTQGTNRFKAYTTDWAPGAEGAFVNTGGPATWEITYDPSNHSYSTTSLGSATNGIPERWRLFWFGATDAVPGADADGDGWTNQEEFLRGSDPVRHEAPRFAVVGQLNGWSWPLAADTNSAAQMRYFGHGLWKYFHWLPIGSGPESASFKIAQGPSSASPNWGAGSVDGFARYLGENLAWLTGTNLEKWQSLTYNERTGAYRIELLGTNAPDADGDGMADEWESFSRLSPFSDDRSGDLDGDSVFNGREFTRGSRADDPSDHFAAMFMPGDAFPFSSEESEVSWQPSEQRVAMKWNTNEARWQALRYIPRPRELQFKFAANASWANAWNWTASNNVPGIARKNTGTDNIRHAFSSAGYHVVSFDEHSGRYSISAMPTNDTTGAGLPDYWQWFHGLANPATDTDADGVTELAEYRRGSDPRRKDRSPLMNVVRNLTADYFENTTPMRWNHDTGEWELILYVSSKPSQKAKFVAGNSWSAPNWGDNLPADGVADSKGENIAYTLPDLPAYLLFRFEEVWGRYRAGVISPADTDGDGLPDDWARYHGVSDALADSDGDGRSNIKEFRFGMNPRIGDGAASATRHPAISLAGSIVNGWAPSGARMTLVDDFTWVIDRQISNAASQAFKFNVGNWTTQWGERVDNASTGRADGSENIGLPDLGSGTYRFVFNEASLEYTVTKLGTYSGRYGAIPPNQKRPGSGLDALNEYFFGGAAAVPPPPDNLPGHSVVNGRLRLGFVARIDDPKLSHTVETSTDLSGGWTTNGVTLMSAETDDFRSGLMRYIYEVQGGGHSRRFLRLRSSLQP